VILVDANLLIYAYSSSSPFYDSASRWLRAVILEAAPVGLPWVVLLAFLRITTDHRAYTNP